ncbi:hypothetical protein K492DRAFT_156902 [Lichtheimia hyalospora FSU 10163]|nr:hypothetical protein K492DRAFT_156902 [Lichtheimia hyalospora FSU 10163]
MHSATSISIPPNNANHSNKNDTVNTRTTSEKLPTVTLTPSATIRNRYYQKCREEQSNEEHHDDKEQEQQDTVLNEEQVGWAMHSYYAPLKSPVESPKSIRSFMSSDAGSIMSLRTEILGTDDTVSLSSLRTTDSAFYKAAAAAANGKPSRSNTLFRSKTGAEPKIVLDGNTEQLKRSKSRGAASLLSRLSKTTAPMRAKLSAMSRSGSSFNLRSHEYTPTPLRRSAESMLNMPITPRKTLLRSKGERSQSFSHTEHPDEKETTADDTQKVLRPHESFSRGRYPALLSNTGQMLQERVTLSTKIKDSIEYKDAFDGKQAVDKLCHYIGTKDRNLALLLGRALDAQKLFHDVNYEHRLRDSVNELYQFKQHINMGQKRFTGNGADQEDEDEEDEKSEFNFMDNMTTAEKTHDASDRLPNGVFTLLTDCYSPTCSRDNLCYSLFCPRRIEQQAKQKTLHRTSSKSSLMEKDDDRLWASTVPKQILSKLSSAEKKRQENIFELIYTERDFVNDLAYVIKYWIEPLLENQVIPEENREQFIQDLFWNMREVHDVNAELANALESRQKASSPIVDQIGDIMLQHVASFGPFVQYGAHQMVSRYVLETEKSTNPAFTEFVETTERLPQSRKLELNAYLTKPTTRLGRYNLLLREILKHTPADHPDQELIPKAMNVISEFLSDVNHETGKMESKFSLQLLAEKLSYKAPIMVDERFMNLGLDVETRKVIMKGPLKRKGSGPTESADVQVYLLDHCLLFVKPKCVNNLERYKIYKKPIPLALLSITLPDQSRRGSTILPYGRPSLSNNSISSLNNIDAITAAAAASSTNLGNSSSKGYPITFNYLGRSGANPVTLYAPTLLGRRQWVDKIQGQRQVLMEKQKVFDIRTIDARFFNAFNRVTCAASYGDTVVLGSDQGVYIKEPTPVASSAATIAGGSYGRNTNENLRRLLPMDKVSQIDVLEPSGLILVLAEKVLYTYSLESLLAEDSAKRGRKLSSHVSFFKVGTIFQDTPSEKTLVCYVRHNTIQSTIRALEPHMSTDKKKSRSKLGRLMRGANGAGTTEGLKIYKDLYLPGEASSIQYFKNIICVGSPKGFQMVDLSSAEVQSVLDPSDGSHHALLHKENLKPISMFRHTNSSILLCYNEMAFYIDKKGRRLRSDWMIRWEGQPTAFAVSFPYIVAFDSTFIEVRDMNTGDLVQVIPGKNVRCLKPDAMDTIYCAMDDPVLGSELVFELSRL